MNLPEVRMLVDGMAWSDWLTIEITRDLGELAGQVRMSARDAGRVSRMGGLRDISDALDAGAELRIEVDGALEFVGHIDEIEASWDAEDWRMDAMARDRTGDLVDCTAAPDGPAEYKGLKLDELARRLCTDFGITVRADVDVGEPFPKFSLDADDLVMDAIEKACRQRAVLAVSDGVGGLLLTRGGSSRAADSLQLPGNVQSGGFRRSHADRFSRYIVKGQTARATGGKPALRSDAAVLQPSSMVMAASAPSAASAASSAARARVTRSGEARDPEILRHRPKVWLSKTESGGASLSEQAAWRMRVARGRADELVYLVLGWHAGTPARRWRPNELVYVDDALAGISGDMLIRRVTSTLTEDGCVTELVVTGPEAFDRIDEGERRRRRRDRRKRGEASGGGSSVATTLQEG